MQVFNKKFLIVAIAIIGVGAIVGISFLIFGGSGGQTTTKETPNNSLIPEISDPDSIFISTDDYEITYQDLYEEVKINDGLNHILNIVDSDLLSSYLEAVTPQEIDDRITKLKYGTNDPDEIAEYTAEQLADMELEYEESMFLLGYENWEREYVRLVVARENYSIEQMYDTEANADEAWLITPEVIAEYYDANYNYDINTIKIRFMSETDAKTVLRTFNLVSKSGELRLYTGDTPLNQVPSSMLNDDNTRVLTDAEILEQFLMIYNYIYGDYRTEVDTDATLEDLLALDDLQDTYDNMRTASSSLVKFVYQTLGTYDDYVNNDDDLLYYTYEPVGYSSGTDTSYYMILNLQRTEKPDVEDFEGTEADLVALIGQDIYDEIEEEIIDNNLNISTFVSNRMVDLRNEHDFDLYDYYFGVDYQNIDSDFELNEEGHETYLCTYGDEVITADDLLTYALSFNAPLYAIYAAQIEAVIAAHYEDIYCTDPEEVCEYDVLENQSERMVEHQATFDSLKTQFESSPYVNYYEFEEYIYLAYGVKNEYDMIYQYYVKSTLQPYLIYDQIVAEADEILGYLLELIQPYYDNYFNLDVNHILIYVDRDENGEPDEYEDFYAALEDTVTYDQKLSDFETAIRTYLDDDDNDFTSFVEEYNDATRDDATWGEFKKFGFNVITEDLGELTFKGTNGLYDENFVDELIALYQFYSLEENVNEESILSDNLVESVFGVHIIEVEKGSAFEKPSAKFSTALSEIYSDDLNNATDELTLAQLRIYADYRFTELAEGTGNFETIYGLVQPEMPSVLLDTIAEFATELYDDVYVVGYLNSIIIEQFNDAVYVNANTTYVDFTEAEFLDLCDQIDDIYMRQIFADYLIEETE